MTRPRQLNDHCDMDVELRQSQDGTVNRKHCNLLPTPTILIIMITLVLCLLPR